MQTLMLALLLATETLVMYPNSFSLRKDPSMKAAVVAKIGQWEEFEVLDESAHPEYVKVSHKGVEGWLPKGIVASSRKETRRRAAIAEDLDKEEAERVAVEERLEAQRERDRAARTESLIAKYGKSIGRRIAAREVWIGMTAVQARESWGAPDDVNKTITAAGTREQWVYEHESMKNEFLYFDDGLLSGIQTSR